MVGDDGDDVNDDGVDCDNGDDGGDGDVIEMMVRNDDDKNHDGT